MTLEDIERKAKNEGRIRKTKQKINEYEITMKNDNQYNKKVSKLRRKKCLIKLLQYFKAIAPYAGLSLFTILITINDIRNGTRKNLVTRETIDSNGNDKIYNEYDSSYALDSGKITHISRWNLNENNEYERITKIYDINNLSPDVAKNIVENDKTVYSLDEMFGEAILTEKEIGKNLTEEELNKPDFLEAVTYSKDKDDYIITKMDASDKILYAIMFFVIAAGMTSIYNLARFDIWNYENALLSIEHNYCEELERLDEKRKTLKK